MTKVQKGNTFAPIVWLLCVCDTVLCGTYRATERQLAALLAEFVCYISRQIADE